MERDLEPLGELIAANSGVKCCPCVDNAIANGTPVEDAPEAITMAPSIQMFTVGGQQVNAAVVLPVCADCRTRQLGLVSKSGLLTA